MQLVSFGVRRRPDPSFPSSAAIWRAPSFWPLSCLPVSLGRVSVAIGDRAAPLFYAGSQQINAQLPTEAQPGTTNLVITVNGVRRASTPLTIATSAPGIFLLPGTNRAVVQNEDLGLNGPSNPGRAGSVVIAYLTGPGPVDNPVAAGEAARSNPLSRVRSEIQAMVGGRAAEILFAGLAPGFVGLMQLNFRLPAVSAGDQQLIVTIGGAASNAALLSVSN